MAAGDPPISIAIIGSGIAGIALAIGLLKQNVPCTIYESAPKFDAIGAGIGLGPNALKAMELMDEKFASMYGAIKVGNTNPEKLHEQFEVLGAEQGYGKERGWNGGSVSHPRFIRSSAHRRDLLEVMESLIPEGTVRFNKRVVKVENPPAGTKGGKVSLFFADGEVVKVDGVLGCDGIKGMTRGVVLEPTHPEEIASKYCHTYVYRGIAPMAEAQKLIGKYAEDAKWFMSKGHGCAIYPISRGKEVNIVVFIHDKNPTWEGEQVARPVSREVMLAEYEEFDEGFKKLLTEVSLIS